MAWKKTTTHNKAKLAGSLDTVIFENFGVTTTMPLTKPIPAVTINLLKSRRMMRPTPLTDKRETE
jgi:hypothetical protein